MSHQQEMSIVRIIARLNVGGPAIQAILMTDAFRARGYEAVLVTGKVAPEEANMDYLAEARNLEVIVIPALSRSISSYKDFISLFQLVRVLRRHRPAIVHTHTAKAGALGRLAAMIVRVPIRVHTFHGNVFNGYFPPLVTRAFLIIERFLGRHTDCIIAISESQKKELTGTYRIAAPQKVVVIPLGLDLAPFLQVNGPEGTLHAAIHCGSAPLVGWVGRFTAIKAPDLFLHCVSLVKGAFPAARYVMVGGGELWAECEQRISRDGLQDSVTLLGWRRNLPEIYADLDVVVSTSINEGTPVALLEAMASGKAIVSTDVGGVRDLFIGSPDHLDGMELFENGILVKRDPHLVACAVRYLLANSERRWAMGQAGREFVRNRFSQLRLADELEQLYVSLARSKELLPTGASSPACKPETVFSSTHTQSS
jgi:glycosyltransferase involved in cell wall biosynthesis